MFIKNLKNFQLIRPQGAFYVQNSQRHLYLKIKVLFFFTQKFESCFFLETVFQKFNFKMLYL